MPNLPVPRRTHALLCAAALVLVLGACGQKGALYHPADAPAKAPATPATPERKDDEKDATERDDDRAPR